MSGGGSWRRDTKEGRLAFLGFAADWWTDEREYDQNKAFAVTDRPVYRPGQTVKFKFWRAERPVRRVLRHFVCRAKI